MFERDFTAPGRSVSVAENGMVASSHPAATLAALDVLRAGGNAVDAAIAAGALQGVIDPHMTGIGGDCFALYVPAGGQPIAINGSGYAPSAISLDAVLERSETAIAADSAHAVTIPGAVAAWTTLNEKYGQLELGQILAPAIKAAEDGYRITPRVAHDWELYKGRVAGHPAAAARFLPNGKAPRTGDRMDNPELGATLRAIATHGASAFYTGAIAEEIVTTLRALGGTHSMDDFADYEIIETLPIGADYRDHMLLERPPNGQGLAALIIARLLDGFDLSDPTLTEVDRIHLLAEASKAAYAQRDALIADPSHMTRTISSILDEANLAPWRQSISLERASEATERNLPEHRDTIYITVVDRDGNAMSFINSIFAAFGSGIYTPKSGVLLQNRGSGFSLQPGHPNAIGPRKRPFHTIIPAMLMNNERPVMPFGVMGGQYQAVGHMHVLSQILDRGFDPQMACQSPRSFSFCNTLSLEPTHSADVMDGLRARGHKTVWAAEPLGGCQAIWIDHERGLLLGASDHRKDGIALGY